jgi:serine/threonine-protein kinase
VTNVNDTLADRPSSEIAARLGLRPGDIVGGRYEIVRLLGEGGMGAVFEARHKVLGRLVAIKVLKPEIARDEKLAARFLQEARSAAELHHRNVVELSDYGVDGDRPYVVMEFLRGETLGRLIAREGPLTPERAIGLLDPVLRALAVAHERGIVHRDIKPENIFLALEEGDSEPTPKIVDFGIAKRHDESVQLTGANMALGTPAYMAPEQIMSSRDVTGAADQYAIGVTLYEALTKRGPYDADTLHGFIVAKATQDPLSLDQVRPDIAPGLVAVVMRSLARKPEERFPSVQALREALAPYRGEVASLRPITGPVQAVGTGLPSTATPASVEIARAPTIAAEKPGRSRVAVVVGAALALVVGVGAVALFVSRAPTAQTSDAGSAVTNAPSRDASGETVVFSIRVEPETAVIRLDGVAVGTGRAEVIQPKDGRRHQLQVTADGYGPISEVLPAEANVNVYRQLVALAQPPTTPPTTPPETPPRTPHDRHGHDRTPTASADAGAVAQVAPPRDAGASEQTPARNETPRDNRPRVDPAHPHIDTNNPFAGEGS